MLKIFKTQVYSFMKSEIDNQVSILESIGLSEAKIDEALLEFISNKDFSIIGLYQKAPRYEAGIELYQEFYTGFSPKKDYFGLAVREEFTDIISPRDFKIPIQFIDDSANQLVIGGDFTSEIEVGDTHVVLDTSNGYSPLGQLTVSMLMYVPNNDVTVIIYNNYNMSSFNLGDILYFVKGNRLTGIDALIKWYDVQGLVVKEKTYKKRFEVAEASSYEYNRRITTVNQMVSVSDGTAIQPFVKSIYEHYRTPYIENYVGIGDALAWKHAIDSETNPQILAYLNIEIPYVNIEGQVIIKKISDWIKDEIYVGYK